MSDAAPPAGVRITLEHVGIAARSLRGALSQLETVLATRASEPENVADEGVRLASLAAGGPHLEVLESLGADSAIGRYLAANRAGLHHLSFQVDGIPLEHWYEYLKSRGVRVLGNGPGRGAENRSVFFVHPASAAGVLIEFSQASGGNTP